VTNNCLRRELPAEEWKCPDRVNQRRRADAFERPLCPPNQTDKSALLRVRQTNGSFQEKSEANSKNKCIRNKRLAEAVRHPLGTSTAEHSHHSEMPPLYRGGTGPLALRTFAVHSLIAATNLSCSPAFPGDLFHSLSARLGVSALSQRTWGALITLWPDFGRPLHPLTRCAIDASPWLNQEERHEHGS
jgi:hypothetical protein